MERRGLMKIMIMMKSSMSYNRIKKDLSKYKIFEHLTKYEELQNILIYDQIDIIVIDPMLEDYEQIKQLSYRMNIDLIEYRSSFDELINQVKEFAIFYSEKDAEEQIEEIETDFSEYERKIEQKIEREEQPQPIAPNNVTEEEEHSSPIPQQEQHHEIKEEKTTKHAKEKEIKQDKSSLLKRLKRYSPKAKSKSRLYIEDEYELNNLQINSRAEDKVIYKTLTPKTIIVGSLWPGAGSTQFALMLARAIAKRDVQVSFVEYPSLHLQPYLFDYINMHDKEQEQQFKYVGSNNDNVNKQLGYTYKGIHFVVNDSRKYIEKTKNFEHMYRILMALRDYPITIVDVSTTWLDEDVKQLLYQADAIYVCLEKDPIKFDSLTELEHVKLNKQRLSFQVKKLLEDIQSNEKTPCNVVTMKDADVVDSEIWNALDIPKQLRIPNVPYETVMKHVWNSSFVYDDPTYHEKIDAALLPIIETLLPKEFVKLKNKSFISKILTR